MNTTEIRELTAEKQALELRFNELSDWFDLTTSTSMNAFARRESLLAGMVRRSDRIEVINKKLDALTASYPEAVNLLIAA